MKRMIDDYIERFYNKEAARAKKLAAKDCALAKEIVAWKEKVAAAWDGIKVFDVQAQPLANNVTGQSYEVKAIVDTNGLGKELGLEMVSYKVEDGEEKLWKVEPFKVVKEEGNVLTFEHKGKTEDPGVFRFAYRLYPINANLPHRQDFAYVRWI